MAAPPAREQDHHNNHLARGDVSQAPFEKIVRGERRILSAGRTNRSVADAISRIPTNRCIMSLDFRRQILHASDVTFVGVRFHLDRKPHFLFLLRPNHHDNLNRKKKGAGFRDAIYGSGVSSGIQDRNYRVK